MVDNRQCINPGQVLPEDIPAYREGEGREAFVVHLQNCPFCQDEVKEYDALEATLHNRLNRQRPDRRLNCPPSQQLVDYIYDLLDPPEYDQVAAHLIGCNYCQKDSAMFQAELTEAAEEVAAVLQEAANRAARLIIARLISSPAPEYARRGASTSAEDELIFEAEDVIVILHRYESKTGLTLQGTISREAPELALKAALLENDAAVAETEVDEAGIFSFDNLGKLEGLTLEIRFPDLTVLIPDLS